jgi:uncharacterized lipoprotein YbaY
MAEGEPLVTGKILVGEDAQPFTGATVYVRLEDVSYADAPSRVIAEQVIHNVSYEADAGHEPEFALHGDIPDERGSYAVRVHVDLHGEGRVQRGDYVSTESYPVLTFGQPKEVSVRVREVK